MIAQGLRLHPMGSAKKYGPNRKRRYRDQDREQSTGTEGKGGETKKHYWVVGEK